MNENKPFARSWLLVDGENIPAATPADCLVITASGLPALKKRGTKPLYLLLNGEMAEKDLVNMLRQAVEGRITGVIVAGCRHGADIQRLDVLLAAAEAMAGTDMHTTRIVALAGDTPAGIAGLESFAGKSSRLSALGGAGESLRQSLGLESNEAEPLQQARGRLVLASAQAGVHTLAGQTRAADDTAFRIACERDRQDGFSGKLVDSDRQAAAANQAFTR